MGSSCAHTSAVEVPGLVNPWGSEFSLLASAASKKANQNWIRAFFWLWVPELHWTWLSQNQQCWYFMSLSTKPGHELPDHGKLSLVPQISCYCFPPRNSNSLQPHAIVRRRTPISMLVCQHLASLDFKILSSVSELWNGILLNCKLKHIKCIFKWNSIWKLNRNSILTSCSKINLILSFITWQKNIFYV